MSDKTTVCCHSSMNVVAVWDDPDIGVAFNIYVCGRCGALAREDVWQGAGVRWLRSETDDPARFSARRNE